MQTFDADVSDAESIVKLLTERRIWFLGTATSGQIEICGSTLLFSGDGKLVDVLPYNSN